MVRRPMGRRSAAAKNLTGAAHERLAVYLRQHNLSGNAASKIFDCVPSYISMLVSGKAVPGLELAARIERITGIECIAWVP